MPALTSALRPLARRVAPVVAGLSLLTPLLVTSAAPAGASTDARRLAGNDRYATAVAVSRSSFPSGARIALLTTGASFPDALAGGPAASVLGGPVLLVARDQVPAGVLEELRRLRPERVLVLGGPAAVSTGVTERLAAESFQVERVAGNDRYETAAAVSRRAFAPGVPVAYLATGADYPDALAGAAAAGADRSPVLLVARDALPQATALELRRLLPRKIVLLGGTGAVSAAVERELATYSLSVTRIAGADRYATAAAVSRATADGAGAVFLANGRGFADALTGGPAAAAVSAPVLLVPPTCLPKPVWGEIDRLGMPAVTLLGGTAVLTAGVAGLQWCDTVADGPLAPGVSVTTLNDPRGPWKGKIVTVSPSAVHRLDTVLAQDTLSGLETTSSMARRTGALVAVNGDFALPGGRPVHPFARNGRLLQTEQVYGRSVAVDARSSRVQLGAPDLQIALTVPSTGAWAPISRVNSGASGRGAVALTTPEAGTAAGVPGASCAARVRPRGAPAIAANGRTGQSYEVREVHCGSAALAPGDDVLTTPLDSLYAHVLRDLRPGQLVSVSWSLGWRDVLDSIGGNPTLVSGGKVVAGNVDGTTPYFLRNPRTAVGYRADGSVLLVTIDGRETDNGAGMSLRELAELFVRLGATEAMGLDGGGSTTMVIGGRVQNTPSDGSERPVSSALIIGPATPPPGGALVTSRPPSAAEQAAAEQQMELDPASSGGFAEAYGTAG